LDCNGKPDRVLELEARPVRVDEEVSIAEPDGSVLRFRIVCIR